MVPRIVFILYVSRSGSTFLAKSLFEKAQIYIPPESNFVTRILDLESNELSRMPRPKLIQFLREESKFQDLQLTDEALAALPSECTADSPTLITAIAETLLQQFDRSSRTIAFKKGESLLKRLPALEKSFQRAHYLWLMRDGRAVYHSQKSSLRTSGEAFCRSANESAIHWVDFVQKYERWSARLPNSLLIKYEDLVDQHALTLSNVMEFLKVENRSEEVEFYLPPRYDRLHQRLGAAPDSGRKNSWREALSRQELDAFLSFAESSLRRYGYEV